MLFCGVLHMLVCVLLATSVLSTSALDHHEKHQVYDRLRYVTDDVNDVTDNVNDILDDVDVYDDCEEVEECSVTEAEECGVCHSVYMRECNIDMEYTYTPVKVKECKEDPDCEGEYKRTCYTKYYTECSTKMVYQDMVEDHPVCSVTKKDRCTSSGCKKVPVMSCKIEKKTSRKSKPETSCERVPTQICRKDKCAPMSCYERVVVKKEMVPKETCAYKEKRICQETEDARCRTVTRKQCTPLPPGRPCTKQTPDTGLNLTSDSGQNTTSDSGLNLTSDSRQNTTSDSRQNTTSDSRQKTTSDSGQMQTPANRQPKEIKATLNRQINDIIDAPTNRQTDNRQPKDTVELDTPINRQTDNRQQTKFETQTNTRQRTTIERQTMKPTVQAKYFSRPAYRNRYHFSLSP